MGGGEVGGEGMEAGEVLGLAGETEEAIGEVEEMAGGGWRRRGRLGFGGEGGGAEEQDDVEGIGQVVPAVGFLVEIQIG